MTEKEVIAQVRFVNQSKIGHRLPVGVEPATITTDYSQNPNPPINPELFVPNQKAANGEAVESTHVPSATQKNNVATRSKNRFFSAPLTILFIAVVSFACYNGLDYVTVREKAVMVNLEWKRVINVEEWQFVTTEGWNLPIGAELLGSEMRIHHYDEVTIGYDRKCSEKTISEPYQEYSHTETTCYSDGTCADRDVYETRTDSRTDTVCEDVPITRSDPVLMLYYFFQHWTWVQMPPVVSNEFNTDPYWPTVLEDSYHRVSGRTEYYSAYLQSEQTKEERIFMIDNADLYSYYRTKIGKLFDVTRNYITGTVSKIEEVTASTTR